MKITHSKAFITGSAQGIGREIALELARNGCSLVLCDIAEDELVATAEECRALSVPVEAFTLDVTDIAAVAKCAETISDVDILINNAGTVHGGGFLETPMKSHVHTSRVNFEGLMAVTHAVLPSLLVRPQAMIVNIASAAGFAGLPFGTSYAATKWAVLGFGESLRLELKEQGHDHIRVFHVCPSYVEGDLFRGVGRIGFARVINPRVLARRIVTGIRRNRRWLRTPWLVALTPIIMALFPRPITDRILRFLGVTTSMLKWQGREETP